MRAIRIGLLSFLLAYCAFPQQEGNFTIQNFRFRSGDSLAQLRLHYMTLGKPARDSRGRVTNAVLLLHGTGGSGKQFLSPQFRNVLFGPGQLLDTSKYYIILPDDIGHGGSSKPSDGMNMRFPHYDYYDMVTAEYQLVTEGLGVNHLRLAMGTSMGCMHNWLWGEMYPGMTDALMPLACLPEPIAGRNRIWRKALMDSIRSDPEWNHGEYTKQPHGLESAEYLLLIAGSSPLQMRKDYPTAAKADAFLESYVQRGMARTDANDLLYQVDSSRTYDPSEDLEKIVAPVMWVNSADDFVNPPELGIAQRDVKRVKRGKFILIPISDATRGHGTHTQANVWKQYLAELLEESR